MLSLIKFRCLLGFHEWIYGEIDSVFEGRPGIKPKFITRMCPDCEKYQYLTQRPESVGDDWYDLEKGQKIIKLISQ